MLIAEAHSLPLSEATQRVKEFIPKLRVQHAGYIRRADIVWDGNSAKLVLTLIAKGIPISFVAEVSVNEREVMVEGKLPLLARALKGKIENMIRDNLRICLAPM